MTHPIFYVLLHFLLQVGIFNASAIRIWQDADMLSILLCAAELTLIFSLDDFVGKAAARLLSSQNHLLEMKARPSTLENASVIAVVLAVLMQGSIGSINFLCQGFSFAIWFFLMFVAVILISSCHHIMTKYDLEELQFRVEFDHDNHDLES